MVESGTINGAQVGTQPYLRIVWEILEQQTANNRSRVNLKLYLVSPYTLNMGGGVAKRGTLYGVSYSYSGGFVGTGTRLISERTTWITHDSDGSREVTFDANFNINITWGGSNLGTLSVSGDAILKDIPRGSKINSAILSNSLRPDISIDVLVNLTRYDSRYRHNIQLRDGTAIVARWENHNSNGDERFTLSTSQVNTLLERLKNVTDKNLTLRVQTISGVEGVNIGKATSIPISVKVHDSVVPIAEDLNIKQIGNSVSSHFLQNTSKVEASFTRRATGGATVASSTIVVRKSADNEDRQDISGPSGVTKNRIRLAGGYEVLGIVTDSRGRSTRIRETFISTPYKSPEIEKFVAKRASNAPATIQVEARGSFIDLSQSNKLAIKIERRQGNGPWETVDTRTIDTNTFEINTGFVDNTVVSSLIYKIRITDDFGNFSEAQNTIPAQKVVLDIHKNEGVGIGGIRQKGELDVHGEAYIRGELYLEPQSGTLPRLRIKSRDENGHAYLELFNNQNVRKAFLGIADKADNDLSLSSTEGGINLRAGNGRFKVNSEDFMTSGVNANGSWLKFYDGTLICSISLLSAGHGTCIDFPAEFIDTEYGLSVIANTNNTVAGYNSSNLSRSGFTLRLYNDGSTVSGREIKVVVIGRWKK